MESRSTSGFRSLGRRVAEILLWLWIGGITAAYLHQFTFVLPHLKTLVDQIL